MKYVQINDGIVQNIILLEDESLSHLFSEGYEFFLSIEGIDPEPQIGGVYNGSNFLPPKDLPIKDKIFNTIRNYQKLSPSLLADIYTVNKLAGISLEQSDKMFDTFADVVLRIREGAFPTALYRLSQKVPEDFVTQELLDAWMSKIKGYL